VKYIKQNATKTLYYTLVVYLKKWVQIKKEKIKNSISIGKKYLNKMK